MAKNSIRDYSNVNSSNTDIQSIDISEGCSPAGINNAIREVMADLKDVSTGAVALESPAFDSASLTGDLTFGDNDKAVFGAGSDLQIYHDGSNSIINDAGTGSLKFQYGGTDGVVFDSSGNVGIGASSPIGVSSTNLTISGSASSSLFLEDTGYEASGLGLFSLTYDDGNLKFETANRSGAGRTGNTERMRIDSSGNVAINTTSPNTSYQTTIQSNSTKGALSIDGPATNGYWAAEVDMPSGSTYGILFKNAGSNVGNIRINASSTSYNTSSDYRLKTAVNYDWDATTRLKQLRPARFEWIADGDDAVPVDGFLAHEVQDIVPEAISGTKDAMMDEEYEVTPAVLDEDGNVVTPAVMGTRSVPDYQGIDQSKLVPLLVKTIQELEARITALEAN